MNVQFPSDVSLAGFLAEYWQRKPLLMRQALPGCRAPLDAEALAGLALEAEVESRLVTHDGSGAWRLRHGPFSEREFSALPEQHWTLLVQDVDKYIEAVAEFGRQFDFIPQWRFDDVMVSYAVDQGSVGPHVDRYDVFLVQVDGQRRWQIGRPDAPRTACPDSDLEILDAFEPTREHLLQPGDVLYLPPGVPHWGVAQGPCMTCSIGYRAPSWSELLHAWCEQRGAALSDDRRYADPPLTPGIDPAAIPPDAIARLRDIFATLLRVDGSELARVMGQLVTEVKSHLQPEPGADPLPPAEPVRTGVRRHPAARLAYYETPAGPILLFANGETHELPADAVDFVRLLCHYPSIDADTIGRWVRHPGCRGVLDQLLRAGVLEVKDA